MSSLVVVYDACVLYPAPLRDLLMELALTDLYRARWTDRIHEEWIRNLLENRPDLKREQLERTKQLMNAHVRDCLVTGYESLIQGLELPDPDDAHVLAAAIKCDADLIVTFNLTDFPADVLFPFGCESRHPDEFVARLFDLNPHAVFKAAENQWKRLRNPPKTFNECLDAILRCGLPQTVGLIREYR